MNRKIDIERILFYYDTIQVFVGIDGVKTRYLCLLFDDDVDRYIAVRASDERLSLLLSGNMDIRQALIESEIHSEYFVMGLCEDGYEILDVIDSPEERMLPGNGLVLAAPNDNKGIIKERTKLNKPVIHLGIADQINSHSIKANSLSKILNTYQDFVSNSHKKLNSGRRENDYTLNVFTTSAASFNVHMYADVQLDLFGGSDIDYTLTFIDNIFNFTDEKDLTEKLSTIKGYAINHYKKLLNELVLNDLSLKYKWTTPRMDIPVSYSFIPLSKLQQAYDIIEKSVELESECTNYSGYFLKVDSTNGDWKFYNEEKGNELKGKCRNPNLLSGITVRTKDYAISCTEKAETQSITEKLINTIYIDDIRPLD